MSYDIRFKVKAEGADVWITVGDCDANITYNVRKIIELSTGLEWKNEANNGLCKDIIPAIRRGYNELLDYPEKYRPYEAANGWGTVDGTRNFFWEILDAWDTFKKFEDPKLVSVTTFWIE